MHLTVLLIVVVAILIFAARALATPGGALAERIPPSWAVVAGLTIGAIAALIVVSTQEDLIPDEVESAALPVIIVVVTIGCAVGAWYRTFRH